MGEAFGQSISPVDVIKSILRQYAFGAGFFREILQNSDDAKATEQEFILDRRIHSSDNDAPKFAPGPVLMAYNNEVVTDTDWTGLQTINSSSKKTDTTKTGKYGSGFRSTFHLTDTPEILSGSYLAMFDPLTIFHAAGGIRHNFIEASQTLSDHLDTFASVSPKGLKVPFNGTAIRLPLRIHDSEGLQAKAISADEIKQIMLDFIHGELGVVMLFLRSVSSIVLKDISVTGDVTTLATARLDRSPEVTDGDFTTYKAIVTVSVPGSQTTIQSWRVLKTSDSIGDYAKLLDEKLGYPTSDILTREKMTPQVGLAAPLDGLRDSGRLFTFLPLPISTGYPCSINGTFALTVDRQHLLNPEEHVAERSHDKLRIEWNKLIFSKTVPAAWSALLRALIQHDLQDNIAGIYQFWPHLSVDAPRGEVMYWNRVPLDVMLSVVRTASEVWPSVARNGLKESLVALTDDVLVASDGDDSKYVDAITAAGVHVLRVPPLLLHVLEESTVSFTPMTPQAVHVRLLNDIGPLRQLASSGQDQVLSDILVYLLSTDSISNVIALPIVPTIREGHVSVLRGGSTRSHTLLGTEETTLFGPFDSSAISLTGLPPNFRHLSVSGTNLHLLAPLDVAKYVSTALEFNSLSSDNDPPNFGLDHPGYVWLQSFWTWLSTQQEPFRMDVFRKIRDMATLPTAAGVTCSPAAGLYAHDDIDAGLRRLLERSKFSFLHASFPATKLSPFHFMRSISDLPLLLEHLQPNVFATASGEEFEIFTQYLQKLLQKSPPLSQATRSRVRNLPIFPILAPAMRPTSPVRGIISSSRVFLVHPDSLLPTVPGVCYVANTELGTALVRAIDSTISLRTEADLASLFVEHLNRQTVSLQAAFIQLINARRDFIPNNTITALGQARFIPVGTGWSFACPIDVVHPEAEVARDLLPSDDPRLPVLKTQEQRDIIQGLAGLGFLITTLTPAIATECITRISSTTRSSDSTTLATRLLSLLERTSLRYQDVQFSHDQHWIPVEGGGLRSADSCRDDGVEAHRSRKLFDRVLDVVAIRVYAPQLRARLGWDAVVHLSVLKKQFNACVHDEPIRVDYVNALINEFGRRFEELVEDDMQWLRTVTDNQEWIPTRDSGYVRSAFAVFKLGTTMPPFREVSLVNAGARRFLHAMGCSEIPSTYGIIRALESLSMSDAPLNVKHVLRLLEALPPEALTADNIDNILIPGDDGRLHPRECVYYNDLGTKAYLVPVPLHCSRAHLHISAGLAAALKLKDLSSLELQDEDEDEDMGESLPTRIGGALRQYGVGQILAEFVANAVDAGAKAVHMVVDEKDFSNRKVNLLTKEMAQFQSSPALVIYNDAVFTDDDFRGIRRVGEGSKRSKSGKIGRFGLGALAAYHLSEVVWIVSGEYALIMDPSKSYLISRASRKVKLQDMRRLFPDQLAPLEGLHGFSSGQDHYQGTLFRLPLRSRTQAQCSQLTSAIADVTDVVNLLQSYQYQAHQSTLFVPIEAVSASRRDATDDKIKYMWSLEAVRTTIPSRDPVSLRVLHEEVQIITNDRKDKAEIWRKGMLRIHKSEVPSTYQAVLTKTLLPEELSVGVAFIVSSLPPTSQLFSHLPLPINTSLPAHIHASFILAEDRRSIRYDETLDEESESSFNNWLLTTFVPDIYLSVLHHWPQSSGPPEPQYTLTDKRFWPQESTDKLSKMITTRLFQRLGEDTRLVCENTSGVRISPKVAAFVDGYSSGRDVRLALESIAPDDLACAPRILKDTTVRQVDQAYVRETIKALTARFILQFNRGTVTVAMVINIVLYLLAGEPEAMLEDLPLLPLADDTLQTFSAESGGVRPSLCWKMSTYGPPPWLRVFPPGRFVHPDVNGAYGVKLLDHKLNIAMLDDQVIGELTGDRIREAEDCVLAPTDASWVQSHFWAHFDAFHSFEEIGGKLRALPLIPVRDPSGRRFISYNKCHGVSTFFAPNDGSLTRALTAMGALLIDRDSLAPSLRRRLDFVEFSVQKVINFLGSARSAFASLVQSDKSYLASWITGEIETNVLSPEQTSIARTLPIWSAQSPASGRSLVAAEYVLMLPVFMSLEHTIRFLGPGNYVEFNHALKMKFNKEPMSVREIRGHLAISAGTAVNSADLPALARLLRTFVDSPGSGDVGTWIVPNATGVYTPINHLFSRTNDLFIAAFGGRRPTAFIHQDLSSLDPFLSTLGLQVEVTPKAFLECALAIQGAQDLRRFDDAATVYSHYRDQLPFQRNMPWRQVEDIRFIHRAEDRRRGMPTFNRYSVELPDIVAPSQLVREEYEAIAWSQRARFRVEPTDRLLAENKTLGVPTLGEVINHLCALRNTARENRHSHALVSDLKATYDFLQSHLDEVPLHAFDREPRDIFLNVDEPRTEWQWVTPQMLIVNAEVDGPGYQKVRKLLEPYEELIVELGGDRVENVAVPVVPESEPEEILRVLRSGFDAKRREGADIDVVFVDGSGERYPAHRIYLAALVPHFNGQFYASGMRESVTSGLEPVQVDVSVEYDGKAIAYILDFLYSGQAPQVPFGEVQILLDAMGLSNYWGLDHLKDATQRKLVAHLSPATYKDIRDYAEKCDAGVLLQSCLEYAKKNERALNRGVSL
ncbi:hypothetical protein OF83DRAFT_1175566 [Amylostereum chailletii]|nr:hypothetical protein OF83DRAFT_1175566 [Amylostereum chailletii]